MSDRLNNFKGDFACVWKMLQAERSARQRDRMGGEAERKALIVEVDHAIAALERMKNLTKALLNDAGEVEPEQAQMFGGHDGTRWRAG